MTRTGPVTAIALSGELDFSNRDAVAEFLVVEVKRPGTNTVCIDLSPVSFLGSAGVQALLIGYRAAEASGRRYTITGASGSPLRVLQLTGVLAVINDDPVVGDAGVPRRSDSEAS